MESNRSNNQRPTRRSVNGQASSPRQRQAQQGQQRPRSTQRPQTQSGQARSTQQRATQTPASRARTAQSAQQQRPRATQQGAGTSRRPSTQQYNRSRYGSSTSPNRRSAATANAGGRGTSGRRPTAGTPTYAGAPTASRSFPTWGIAAIIAAVVVVVAIVGFTVASGRSGLGSTSSSGVSASDAGSSASSTQMTAEDKTIDATPISFTMSFTGDCCLGNDENFGYSTRMPEYYDNYGPTYFFQNVKSIFDADDYTVVDMEGTFTTRDTRNGEQFAFKADPEYVNILTYGNVQAATLANNHSSDYGAGSYTDTWQTLENAGIVPFGYDDIAYVDIKGVKVALYGMYELDEYLGIKDSMLENIQKAKDAGAQVIIMCAHWGEEKMYVPDEIQVELAHAAIDAGCDLIVGCHPHRVQGIEIYKGKYIAYSMGNFCFCGNNAPADMDCYIFQQTFTVVGGELQIDNNVNVIPCSISSDDTMNNYQPTPATGTQATEIMSKIADCNAQLAADYGVTTM